MKYVAINKVIGLKIPWKPNSLWSPFFDNDIFSGVLQNWRGEAAPNPPVYYIYYEKWSISRWFWYFRGTWYIPTLWTSILYQFPIYKPGRSTTFWPPFQRMAWTNAGGTSQSGTTLAPPQKKRPYSGECTSNTYIPVPTDEVVILWHFTLEDLRWEIILAGYREFHNHWQWWLMASSAKDIYKKILEFQAPIVLCAWAISSKYVHHNISWTVIVSNLPMVTWELLKHACFAPKTNLLQHCFLSRMEEHGKTSANSHKS